MARFSKRKRRRTSNWFPVLGDLHTATVDFPEPYRFSSFEVPWGILGTSGQPTTTVRTITIDDPRPLNILAPILDTVDSMADVEGSAYMFDGIVGSITNSTHAYDDDDVTNNPNTPPAFIVGAGFRVSEWDPHSDTSEDSLYNEVLNAENYARSRWIWRRVWNLTPTFANLLPGSWGSASEFDYVQFPSGVPGPDGGYAGGLEATNITAKSKRRVSNDERLVFCVSIAALPISIGQRTEFFSTSLTGVSVLDIRLLGHMVKNKAGSRG